MRMRTTNSIDLAGHIVIYVVAARSMVLAGCRRCGDPEVECDDGAALASRCHREGECGGGVDGRK